MKLTEHPRVKQYYEQQAQNILQAEISLDEIKSICLEAGADDVGVVSLNSDLMSDHVEDINALFPATKAVISIVFRLNKESIRCPDRSVSDFEFIHGFDQTSIVSRNIIEKLNKYQIWAVNPSIGFPMDMEKWTGKMWSLAHKTIAVAAGMGVIGHNRLLIHPTFGGFVVLGSILIACGRA